MLEANNNQNNSKNGRDRTNLTLLILILGVLSVASIGILVLSMLRQLYPKVFAAPGIAKQLNYQGKLQDAGGMTVPDGSYAMQFTVYDAPSGGNILWTSRETDTCGAPFNPTSKSVSVYNGIFSTLLGESGDCPINLDFADDAYYLGVTIGADPEMSPRKRIGAAGYAFNADLLDGLNTSNSGGSNAFVPVTDAGGNFVLSSDVTFDTNTFMLDSTNDAIGIGGAPTPFAQVYVTTAKISGLYAETSAAGGRGVSGAASATTGLTAGGSFTAGPPPGLLLPGADIGVFGAGFSPTQTAYGGYFMGGDYGIYGTESNAAGYGLYGSAAGKSGTGIFGQATNSAGTTYGVRGQATGTLVANYGGYFSSAGAGGYGVYGTATDSTAAVNYGGYFTAAGTGFVGPFTMTAGVYGEATSTAAVANAGGYFAADGTGSNASGVVGIASGTGVIQNNGGIFLAYGDTGRGVYGQSMSTAASANFGVRGNASGTGAGTAGVYGFVGAAADNIYGVRGEANNTGSYETYGGYFKTQSQKGRGVYGGAYAGPGSGVANYGGYFEASSDIGYGVYGEAMAGAATTNYGGYFKAQGGTGYGVYGEATATGPVTNYGGYFTAAGDTGIGVYGTATSPTGWAGYFTGGQGTYTNKEKIGPATTAPAENLDVVGNIANLADANFNPVLKSSTATGAGAINAFVSGKYAYVANNGASTLEIFDITNPSAPALVGSAPTSLGTRFVYVAGKYAYVVSDLAGTLQVFDVSNPSAPTLAGLAPTTAIDPKSVYVFGHYAYIAEAAGNLLEIFDVSNPTAPISMGSAAAGGQPFYIYVSGKYAYVVNMTPFSTFQIFDISNVTAPLLVSTTPTGADPRTVYVSGRYAYVGTIGAGTLEIYDISNPAIPTLTGSTAAGNLYGIYVSGRYAYGADIFSNQIKTVDVSNSAAPVVVGSAMTGANPTSIFVSGRYAYTTDSGANTLSVLDVSGLETTSAMIHSLEAGSVQVRNDIFAGGELSVNGGLNVGGTGFFNDSLSVHSNGGSGGYFQADASGATGLTAYTSNTLATAISAYALGGDSTGVSVAVDPLAAGLTLSRGGLFSVGTGSTILGGASHMIGVQGIADGGTATNYGGVFSAGNLVSLTIAGANNIGVAGFAEDSAGTNYGGYFQADGTGGAGYGVYSTVVAASDWAGYFTGGYGLYTSELHVNDPTAGVGYNRIGTNATGHGLSTANDLLITGNLEVDGSSWFDGGHTDLAEMINYTGSGEAGDVIVVDKENDNTAHLADKAYDSSVIGIISTNPSLVITGDIKEGKLLAVAGRVPTKVTNLNGPIARGDLLTTSVIPGHAMKATESGPTVGKALEPCDADSCTIWVFLNVGWNGGSNTNAVMPSSNPSVVYQNLTLDKLTNDLDSNGFAINNVSKIISKNEVWSIDENGLLKIKVEFERDKEILKKEIYALSSTGVEVVLSGSSKMDNGEMLVDFSQVDKDFTDIIDPGVPLKISVTPTENCRGLYVAEKYPQGFKVKELDGGVSDAAFDWIVIGRRVGYGAERE